MKLTLYDRTEVLRALIYRRLIHRTEPNRPHISSDISISNSVETKRNQMRPNSLARLACIISVFRLASRCRVARLAPRRCLLAPPVRGVLRLVAETRNPFFREKCIFCDKPCFPFIFRVLRQFNYADPRSDRNILRRNGNRTYQILGYPQSLPQDSMGLRPIYRRKSPRVGAIHTLLSKSGSSERSDSS